MMADEVLAYCGSCKMDLMAMVVARVSGKIAKVHCKTCKKERVYKAPKGVNEPNQAPAVAKPTGRKKSSAAAAEEAASAKTVAIESEWKRLLDDAAQANRIKYSPKAKLGLGDVVQHPTFGEGVVMRIAHPDKAEIIFKNDIKLLVHSRS